MKLGEPLWAIVTPENKVATDYAGRPCIENYQFTLDDPYCAAIKAKYRCTLRVVPVTLTEARPAQGNAGTPDLHAMAMNTPVDPGKVPTIMPDVMDPTKDHKSPDYLAGHRDARHAIAEKLGALTAVADAKTEDEIWADVQATFRRLVAGRSDEQRLKLFNEVTEGYCPHCGCEAPCHCWNDE